MPEIRVFISHASADENLARATVHLLEQAMKLRARVIRCTSLDGYRLKAGAKTDDALRAEIFDSEAFLALITPSSLASTYVLFELGARWGADKHLLPLLARGATTVSLRRPLNNLNALDLSERAQVLQLLTELAATLSAPLEPFASLDGAVDELLLCASDIESAEISQSANTTATAKSAKPGKSRSVFELEGLDLQAQRAALIKMKKRLADGDSSIKLADLAAYAGITEQQAHALLIKDPNVVFKSEHSWVGNRLKNFKYASLISK